METAIEHGQSENTITEQYVVRQVERLEDVGAHVSLTRQQSAPEVCLMEYMGSFLVITRTSIQTLAILRGSFFILHM